jgi:hypothetical protein
VGIMSWDDHVFEDPWESYDRSQEEPLEEVKRKCKKCDHIFWSAFPQACPECGGWTDVVNDNKKR